MNKKNNYLIFLIFLVSGFSVLSCSSSGDGDSGGSSSSSLCSQSYPDASTSQYVLPFNIGESYLVSQGNCTTHTHTVQSNLEYAYDFAMSIGTDVYAARGGTVYAVGEDAFDGTTGIGNINYVQIDHGDGSIGNYFHLTHNGALVEPGDVIMQGQLIALSGNSGTQGRPHLHFHVHIQANNENGFQTIPVSFLNVSPSDDNKLYQGNVYTALSY